MTSTEVTSLDPFILDFRGSMWDCRPRMLWQKLFDFYRDSGCPLDHMDNILIDLRNCQELFDSDDLGFMKGTLHFIFGWCPGHFMTTWIPRQSWLSDDPKLTIRYSNFDRYLVCSVNDSRAKLIPIIMEEK